MTALAQYARLEATGLWRATPDAQRREVVVSIGEATLVISDLTDTALTHWSLAAIERTNPGAFPAIFHPDGDPDETLELPEAEAEMIEAIDRLRRAVNKTRPKPGRLRLLGVLVSLAVVAALIVFWVPDAMKNHALRVVPDVKRVELGQTLLGHIERASGPACADAGGLRALGRLAARLEVDKVAVLPAMTQTSLHLPGNLILLNRSVVEDHDAPDVAAGYILSEDTQRRTTDPLQRLLEGVGLRENFRLLTTGSIAPEALNAYAEALLTRAPETPETETLLARFDQSTVRSTPYAYAKDITGETVLALIEGDPMTGRATAPLLPDATWLRLQSICGG